MSAPRSILLAAVLAAWNPAWGQAPASEEPGGPGSFASTTQYRQGLALERRGDEQGAFRAFLDAGEGGHGLAQLKLGEIYDKGGPVERDYETSLKWYEKARAQGVAIPKPAVRTYSP